MHPSTTIKQLGQLLQKSCGKMVGAILVTSDNDGREFYTNCSCCAEYHTWKIAHELSANLQKLADQPRYYSVTDETVEVIIDGDKVVYKCTIQTLKGASKGKCLKVASTSGKHPYICDACDALRHGRHSQLNRKLQCATTL